MCVIASHYMVCPPSVIRIEIFCLLSVSVTACVLKLWSADLWSDVMEMYFRDFIRILIRKDVPVYILNSKADVQLWSNWLASRTRTALCGQFCCSQHQMLNCVLVYKLAAYSSLAFVDLSYPGSFIKEERNLQCILCCPFCSRCFAVTCSTRWGRWEMRKKFYWENVSDRDHLSDLGLNGNIILQFILKTRFWRQWTGFMYSGWCSLASCYVRFNESSVSLKDGEFLEYLSDY
jgi:hypothetical protein